MRFWAIVLKGLVVLAGAAGCAGLSAWLGPWKALAAWAVLMAALCAILPLLIRAQPAGRITLVNYAMGNVLQWGYRAGRGRLPAIAAISWGVWMLIGAAVIFATTAPITARAGSIDAPAERGSMLMVLLVLAWVVDGVLLLHVGGQLLKDTSPSGQIKALTPVAAILLVMILGSAALVAFSSSVKAARAALLLAGGPPLIVGLFYGLFVLIIVVLGRNTRWN